MKKRDVIKEAKNWAFGQSGSKATTEKGIEKAVTHFEEKHLGKTLVESYINNLHASAESEMRRDLMHKIDLKVERKKMKKIPAYARFFLACTEEVKKTYKGKKGSDKLPGYLENPISRMAFSNLFENTRLRKIYEGENSHITKIRTEDNDRMGWDKVVWHYADYSVIISPDGRKIFTNYGQGYKEYQVITNGSCVINGRKIRKLVETCPAVIKPHHLRRIFEEQIRGKNIIWRWNMKDKSGEYIEKKTGEAYHTSPATRATADARGNFLASVIAFQARRDEKKISKKRFLAEKFLTEFPQKIWVEYSDSVEAGNCKSLTTQFQEKLLEKYGINSPNVCIRADIILGERDDSYTRRACITAAMKSLNGRVEFQ